jgi:hypothetical protein
VGGREVGVATREGLLLAVGFKRVWATVQDHKPEPCAQERRRYQSSCIPERSFVFAVCQCVRADGGATAGKTKRYMQREDVEWQGCIDTRDFLSDMSGESGAYYVESRPAKW